MAENNAGKTRAGGPLLLPSSGLLISPSQTGSTPPRAEQIPVEKTGSDHAFPAHFGADAKELVAKARKEAAELAEMADRAAALAGEKAPLILEKAGDLAASARAIATEKAPLYRKSFDTLKDRTEETVSRLRENGVSTPSNRRRIVIIAAAVALAAGLGGWLYAARLASDEAREKIEAFLSGNGLSSNISYANVSASPFGAVTLSGVVVKASGGNEFVKIGSLSLSGVDIRNGTLAGLDVSAHSIEMPVLAIARADRTIRKDFSDLIGLGYTLLKGKVFLSVGQGGQKNTLAVEVNGEIDDMGSIKGKASFSGVDPQDMLGLVRVFQEIERPSRHTDPAALFGAGIIGLERLSRMSLDSAEFVVDNRDYVERGRDIPASAIPASEPSSLAHVGLASSGDVSAHKALSAWRREGGKLRIATRATQPVQVFAINLFGNSSFLFENIDQFLARTNAEISF